MSSTDPKSSFGSAAFWRYLKPLLQPHWRIIVAGLLINALHGIAVTFQTLTPKYLIDDILLKPGYTPDQRLHLSVLLAVAYLASTILFRMGAWHLSYRIFARVREDIVIALRARFFRQINSLCLRFHGKHNSGELFSYLFGTPLTQIQTFLQNLGLFGPGAIFTLVSSLAWAASWDLPMTILLVVCVATSMAILNHTRKRMRHLHEAFQDTEREVSGRAADLIRGSREIKLYGIEDSISNDFEQEAVTISRQTVHRDIQGHVIWMKNEGTGYFFFALICVVGTWRCLHAGLRPGELLAYMTSFIALQNPLQQLFNIATLGGAAEASFARMTAVFEALSSTPDPKDPLPVPTKGDIVFEDVHFRYTSKPVLNGVSFRIPYGQRIAIVGPSGAGKTTISQLVLRLYDPAEGNILMDGISLQRFAGAELRKRFGVVPQAPYFFQTTIRKNLMLVRPDATDAMIREACESANAWEFIEKLPDQLDTPVGEAGSTLSGGQRQRLAIARALLIDPSFFVFDEATSALDTVSERLIHDSLGRNLAGRTAIFIAHRLATIRSCDRVLVMEDGKVVQDGTFEELCAVEGTFRRMIEADVFGHGTKPGSA